MVTSNTWKCWKKNRKNILADASKLSEEQSQVKRIRLMSGGGKVAKSNKASGRNVPRGRTQGNERRAQWVQLLAQMARRMEDDVEGEQAVPQPAKERTPSVPQPAKEQTPLATLEDARKTLDGIIEFYERRLESESQRGENNENWFRQELAQLRLRKRSLDQYILTAR